MKTLYRVWKSFSGVLEVHINRYLIIRHLNGFGRRNFNTENYLRSSFGKTILSSYKQYRFTCSGLIHQSGIRVNYLPERLFNSGSLNTNSNNNNHNGIGSNCWQCGQSNSSFPNDDNLFCSFCGTLQQPEKSINYFKLLNM